MGERLINVEDDLIKPLLSLLLKDKTTGENIIWATDTYCDVSQTKSPGIYGRWTG